MRLLNFLFLIACLPVLASDITVIVNGSPGGTFYNRSEFYINGLKNNGYSVAVINQPKSNAAADLFNKIDNPVLMVWIDALAPIRQVRATDENFVAIEYTANLYICGKDLSVKKGTVGHPKMYILDPVRSQGDYTFIPYKNTGETLNAAIAGEVDFAYANQTVADKMQELGMFCKTIENVAQTAFVVARNIDLQNIRKIVLEIQTSEQFQIWLQSNKFNNKIHSDRMDELLQVNKSENAWINAFVKE